MRNLFALFISALVLCGAMPAGHCEGDLSSSAVLAKLEKIERGQEAIQKELEEIRAQLDVIKVRVTMNS